MYAFVAHRCGHVFFNVFTNDVQCDVYKNPVASINVWPPDDYRPLTIPAQSLNGLQFGFCGGFGVNPLQSQPGLSLPVVAICRQAG
jgi:hypothetical protein